MQKLVGQTAPSLFFETRLADEESLPVYVIEPETFVTEGLPITKLRALGARYSDVKDKILTAVDKKPDVQDFIYTADEECVDKRVVDGVQRQFSIAKIIHGDNGFAFSFLPGNAVTKSSLLAVHFDKAGRMQQIVEQVRSLEPDTDPFGQLGQKAKALVGHYATLSLQFDLGVKLLSIREEQADPSVN